MTLSCSYRVERNPFFDEKSAPARPCVLLSDTTLLVVSGTISPESAGWTG